MPRRQVRVLVVSPHPDDEAIGCGGTLRRHVLEGARAHVVFLTSGEAGGHGGSPADTARRREREAGRAAARLGLEGIEFWRLPDGRLEVTPAAVAALGRALARLRPHVVYTPHAREAHRDHRTAARLVRVALRARPARSRPEAWGFEVWTPIERIDRVVDITRCIGDKLRAIRAYRSQCRVLAFDQAMRGLARYRGEMHCWPEGEYAEVFRRL